MNIPIYDGNPLWNPNAVPFGFYSNDIEFQVDCVKVAKFVTTRVFVECKKKSLSPDTIISLRIITNAGYTKTPTIR